MYIFESDLLFYLGIPTTLRTFSTLYHFSFDAGRGGVRIKTTKSVNIKYLVIAILIHTGFYIEIKTRLFECETFKVCEGVTLLATVYCLSCTCICQCSM